MAESQSRYGIVEELNNRKIKEREKLANLEREKDTRNYEVDKNREEIKQGITDRESVYVQEHKDRVRGRDVQIKMLETDYLQLKDGLEDTNKKDKESYKQNFKVWKESQLEQIETAQKELKRYNEVHDKKISDKEEVIVEIEKGIDSLKEISSEQKEKKD